MDKRSIPPDPGVSKDVDVTRFLELAENSSDFSNIVNQNVQFVERLDLESLLAAFQKCGAPTGRAKSAEASRAALFVWVETSRRNTEGTVTSHDTPDLAAIPESSSDQPSSCSFQKKRPSSSPAEKVERRPEPVEKSLPGKAFNEGTVGEMMLGVVKVTDKLQATLSAAQGFVQSVCHGHNFEKHAALDLLASLKLSAAEISGLQVGLGASHQACRLLDLAESQGEMTYEMGSSLGQTPSGSSYIKAVKKGLDNRSVSQSKETSKQAAQLSKRDVTRKKIAAQREALRRDELALRLRACSSGGVVANHLIAEAVAKTAGREEEQYRALVTDVRIDRFGTYYVQIQESEFQDVRQRLREQMFDDDTVTLLGLGDFKLWDPVVSAVKGKEAVVIKGVDVSMTMEQVVREIWLSNRPFWNLEEDPESMNAHITEGKRLQMKKRNEDGSLSDELIGERAQRVEPRRTAEVAAGSAASRTSFDLKLYMSHQYKI